MTRPMPALTACIDVVGRSGARAFEVGYLHDDVPPEQAAWWASAEYRGARYIVENHVGPEEACEALAIRMLSDSRCTTCGRPVQVGIKSPRFCTWTRSGDHWSGSCETP